MVSRSPARAPAPSPAVDDREPADVRAALEPAAVPISGLASMRWPADDLLWEWARWVPPLLPVPLAGPPAGASGELAGPLPESPGPQAQTATEPAVGEPSVPPAGAQQVPAGPAPAAGAPVPEGAPSTEVAATRGERRTRAEPGAAEAQEPAAEGDVADPQGGLSAWSSRLRGTIKRRVVAPPAPDPEVTTTPIRESVSGVRRRETARRGGSLPGVKAAMPKPPVLPDDLPPPPALPSREAEAAVTAALGKQLPRQVLPELQDYVHTAMLQKPATFTPKVGFRLPEGSTTVLTPVPPPPVPGREGRSKLAKVKAAGKVVPQPGVKGAFTLGTAATEAGTKAPPTALPGPPVTRADIAGVLVRLRASVPADSEAILIGARSSMYGMGVVQRKLPGLGKNELLPGLVDRVGAGVDAIASRYRIDLGILHAATLDQHGKIQGDLATHVAAVDKTADKAKRDTAKEGQASADTIAGAKAGADAAVDEKLLEASGGASPAAIRAQRDRLIGRVNRRLAPEDIRYEKEGEDRLRALEEMEGAYTVAYRQVARQVADRIRRDTEPVPGSTLAAPVTPAPIVALPPEPSTAAATPAESWTVARIREVRAQFTELKKAAQEAVKANRGSIDSARSFAILLFTRWADEEIGDRGSAWDRFWDWILTWSKAADDRTLAWEEAKMANLAVDLQGDLAFVNGLASGARSEAEMRAVDGLGGLSKAQQAIMTAYFEKKPPRNPLDAVAIGMRVRIAEALRPRLVEQLDTMLYALPVTQENVDNLSFVADSLGMGDPIKKRGQDFHAAVDQWGTDEAKVYRSLGSMTRIQRHALDMWYRFYHHSSIDAELADELSDAELDRARDLMAGDQLAADAAAIRAAIEGPGTDEEEIYRALRNKTAEERSQLEAIYLSRYKISLHDDLKSDLSGKERDRAEALRAGDVRKADAIGLEYAQSGKWYGAVDTDAIQAIYATNRAEVEAEAAEKGMDSKAINAAVLARNKEIDTAHAQHFKEDGADAGPGLRASFAKNLTGPARDLALGLQDQDWARADAARLELERRSFITSDKVVNQILESQYTRAKAEVVADEEHKLAYRRDLAMVRGERWDDKVQREAMRSGIEAKARERSAGYMSALKATYDTAYQYDPIYAVNGRGGFDNLIDDHLMGSDRDRAKALVAGGGYLSPAQEIKFAVQGPGTDVDVIKRMLAGKSPDEIKAIETEWNKWYPKGPSLRDRVMDEVSGRDSFDIGELFRGEPQTPDEKLAAAKRKQHYEATAYGLGSSAADRSQLDHEVAVLEKSVAALGNAPKDSEEAKYYSWEVGQGVKNVDAAVEEHRRGVDAVTDRWAMIAAIVAGVAVTALTFGAAGPLIAGALGALAAAEATILTKLAVKGSAYSNEEILVDVVSGAVDVVFAVLTAGVGNALLRVSKGIPIGPLAKLATSASRTKRMIAHGLANGVEGFLSGIPSAAAGSLADEKTWTQGDAFTNFVSATGMGALTGAFMGGVMGSTGGLSKAAAHGPHLDPGRPPDLDAAAKAFDEARVAPPHVDPEVRAGQWHAHQSRHPGASYADFLADLDAGRIAPDPAAGSGFRRAARQQLGAGLPAADRKLIEVVPVRVLDDAEFGRLTRSSSGQAATVLDNGKPLVLIRESAPLAVLREEGIHAAQLLDPKLAGTAQLLDEARMVRWSSLDLRTKLKMYAAKLDLEIDAHLRLIKGLVDELDQMPPGVARDALEDQVGAARRNLGNLGERKLELASFGPLDRLKARLGFGTLATRLEQPPRLFSKNDLAAPGTAATKPKKKGVKKGAAPAEADPMPEIHPDPAQFGEPPAPTAQKRQLGEHERSRSTREEGVLSAEQVGNEWREHSARGDAKVIAPEGDRYRRVEITKRDGSTVVVDETVVRGSDPPTWVLRGKAAGEAGALAEEASLAMTRRKIAADHAAGITTVTLGDSLQNRSGHGFDEVYVEFHPDGRVEIVVVEVKDYGSRRVPLEDFTAVLHNLKKNLEVLSGVLMLPRSQLPLAFKELDAGQLRALRQKAKALAPSAPDQKRVLKFLDTGDPSHLGDAALGKLGVTLELRLGPTTGLGGTKAVTRPDTALRRLERLFERVRDHKVEAGPLTLTRRAESLNLPEGGTARLLDAHDQLASKGLITESFHAVADEPGVFHADNGVVGRYRPLSSAEVLAGAHLDKGNLDRIANDAVADLTRRVSVNGAPHDLHVILDTSAAGFQARLWLETAIAGKLTALGRASELAPRLHVL